MGNLKQPDKGLSKPDLVARDFVKVPVEVLKLHKEVYMTPNLFFVNKILVFLMLSHKICFMAVNHLADRTVPQIFMAFKEIYQYYLHCGFHITMVHVLDQLRNTWKTII